jgi:D-glycero-alpha-D-manno-heptose-7-phosphate kinase
MIITQTPLRVSLLGGGTDFRDFFEKHGGYVLTTTINKYIYCIVKERFDRKIYINYSEKEIVDDVSQIKHELVREAMRKTGVTHGIEISFMSDIPSAGSGLGSSSSVTVGVLNALYLYTGRTVGTEQLAREACEIEIDILKKPIGVQDQYIAAYGGLRFMEFTKFGIGVDRVAVPREISQDLADHMMLFFTGVTRKSGKVLKQQKKKISDNNDLLVEMGNLARKGVVALEREDFKKLGLLIDESWRIKKKFANNITTPQIDRMYNLAMKAGAIGGKISGAGNGGFLMLIVEPNKHKSVREALSKYRYFKVGLSYDGAKAIFNIRN